MINSTPSRMFKNLDSHQFKIIGDKAWYGGTQKKIQRTPFNMYGLLQKNSSKIKFAKRSIAFQKYIFSSQFCQCVIHLIKSANSKIPVFDPSGLIKVIWDILTIIFISGYFFLIPLFMTFISLRQSQFFSITMLTVPIFTALDFFIKTNTGCYEKGKLITQREICFKKQAQKYFLIDLFIFICFLVYIVMDIDSDHLRIADFLLTSLMWKVKQFMETLSKLEQFSFFNRKQKDIIALFKLIFTIIMIAHILSCLWIAVAEFEEANGFMTWLKNRSFSEVEWHEIYVDSYYFTTVTMITVGFGDIIPYTELEKTVCIIFMIFSCGVFAYSMSTIGSILQSFNEDKQRIQQNMSIINSYMKRKKVGKRIQSAIREYLEYYWQEQSERYQEQEDKIISILSENLRENLLMEGKGVALKGSAIFRDNFSEDIRLKMVPHIKEYCFTPEETICFEGEDDDYSIFFIEKGSVNIYFESSSSTQKQINVSTLFAGQSFGEISFFTGKPRTASVQSKEFTTLLIIKRSDFLEIIKSSEHDYEKFCTIKDCLSLFDDFSLINVKCLSCGSLSHQIIRCPFLHFIPKQSNLLKQYCLLSNQSRFFFKRRNLKSIKTLYQKELINQFTLDYNVQRELSSNFYRKDIESNNSDSDMKQSGSCSFFHQKSDFIQEGSFTKKQNHSQMISQLGIITEEDSNNKSKILSLNLGEKRTNNENYDEQKAEHNINIERIKKKRLSHLSRDQEQSPVNCQRLIKKDYFTNRLDCDDIMCNDPNISSQQSFVATQIANIKQPASNQHTVHSPTLKIKLHSILKQISSLMNEPSSAGVSHFPLSHTSQDPFREHTSKFEKNSNGNIKSNPSYPSGIYKQQIHHNLRDRRRKSYRSNPFDIVASKAITNLGQSKSQQGDIQTIQPSISFYELEIFDLMKEYIYYFPLNNLSHCIKLLKLSAEQKNHKLLRHHADNMRTFKKHQTIANYSKKTKRLTVLDMSNIQDCSSQAKENAISDDENITSLVKRTKKSNSFKSQSSLKQLELNMNLEKFGERSQRNSHQTICFTPKKNQQQLESQRSKTLKETDLHSENTCQIGQYSLLQKYNTLSKSIHFKEAEKSFSQAMLSDEESQYSHQIISIQVVEDNQNEGSQENNFNQNQNNNNAKSLNFSSSNIHQNQFFLEDEYQDLNQSNDIIDLHPFGKNQEFDIKSEESTPKIRNICNSNIQLAGKFKN